MNDIKDSLRYATAWRILNNNKDVVPVEEIEKLNNKYNLDL